METASAAYDLEVWHELYVMVGGAAGALAGLLFVAVSINLDRIIGEKGLPRRAGRPSRSWSGCSYWLCCCWCHSPCRH